MTITTQQQMVRRLQRFHRTLKLLNKDAQRMGYVPSMFNAQEGRTALRHVEDLELTLRGYFQLLDQQRAEEVKRTRSGAQLQTVVSGGDPIVAAAVARIYREEPDPHADDPGSTSEGDKT
jgi:hypothetical protein